MTLRMLALVALVAAGCGKGKDSAAAVASDDPAELDFVVSGTRGDLAAIKAGVGSNKPSDVMFKCAAAMANLDVLKRGDAALGGEIEKLCGHDMWAAQIKVSVEATEAERKAKSGEQFVNGCYDAELTMAKDELEKAKRVDATTRGLLDRYLKVCPDAFKK